MEYLKTISIAIWWIILKKAASADEIPTFLATESMCITNGPSAIAYIAPVNYAKNKVSQLFPLIDDDISCEIEDGEDCTEQLWVSENWKVQNSIDGAVKKVITDWRWEAFPLFKTEQIDDEGVELKYEHVLSFPNGDFDIPFSVRAEKEAHVFLCEHQTTPHDSNCYWFMLLAFNGKKSALRRCESGYIDDVYGNWAGSPCKDILNENEIRILSEDSWNHFRLTKRTNTTSLIRDKEVLLWLTDNSSLQVQHMFIHSKRVNTLWKVHNYSYIFTTAKVTEQKGPDIAMAQGQNCLSVFVAMCLKCELTVLLRSDEGKLLHTQRFTTQDENWKEIKILPNLTSERCKLFLTTDSAEDSGLFWAVDKFRRCSPKEYRFLKSPDSTTPCQFLGNADALVVKMKTEISVLDTHCPGSTFGSQCIPCQIFGGNLCNRFEYCETFNGATRCYCSAGFVGEKCNRECNYGRYGHGCELYCSINCVGNCHFIDGYCLSGRCRNNFTGEKCDKAPTKVRDLMSFHHSSTSIGLKWKAPQSWIIKQYAVKYRFIKDKGCSEQTKTLDEYSEEYTNVTNFALENLNPYSFYEISVHPVLEEGPGEASSIEAETQMLETLDIENDVPRILAKRIHETNVTLLLNALDCNKITGPIYLFAEAKCEEDWCGAPRERHGEYDVKNPKVVLDGLFANVQYALVMKISRDRDWTNAQNILDNFKTDTGVPNSITDVTVTSKDESSISFRWRPPYPPTGILKKYNITYYTYLYASYSYKTTYYRTEVDPIDCKLWRDFHCATITDGIEDNLDYYDIQFWATNESPLEYVKVYPQYVRVTAGTAVPEAPYDVIANWTQHNDLLISWKHPNATNGLIKNFTITLNNLNRTSEKIIVTKDIKSEDDYKLTYTSEIKHADIRPCSEYNVTISVYNTKYDMSTLRFTRSPPPIPPTISEEELKTDSTNHTITINIPSLQYNLSNEITCEKKLYLLIVDSVSNETNIAINNFKKKLPKKVKDLSLAHYRLLLESDQEELPITFEIGNGNVKNAEIGDLPNPPLEYGRDYNISLFFVNTCNKKIRFKRVNKITYTEGYSSMEDAPNTGNDNNGLYPLILLIFLIPLLAFVYIYIKRQKPIPDILAVIKQPQRRTIIRQSKDKKDEGIPLSDQKPTRVAPNPIAKPRMSLPGRILPVLKTTHSRPIKITDFESYVRESIDNEELLRQHELFPRGQTKPWECGAMKVNKVKNRYNNLFAYDHTRVRLRKIPGVEHSDYINANYIDGYRSARAYIATQGPKACTLNDFWRMIWDENVKHVVMLANIYESGKKKVEKYWPNINEEKQFDDVRVQYISTEVFANYELRVFNVYKNKIQRKVDQLHFTTWPDHGVPLYSQSLVPFLQRILKIPNSSNSPVVIHCSAGVGRTGTIILCDICLRMAAAEGSIDFLANLENLRSQRANMVDNVEQYKLAHLVVLECLFGMNTSIPCNDDMDSAITRLLASDGVKTQLRYLLDAEWQDRAMDTVWDDEDVASYPEKNRFHDIIPEEQHRVFLLRYPPEDDRSSYINAVEVDGFRSPGRFIVTQQPMPNTLGDFWRMVAERKSNVIISLNEINKSDKTACQFWPDKSSEIHPADYLTVSHVSSTLLDCYRIITVRVTNHKTNENELINIVSMINWAPTDLLPNSVEEFLSFWEDSDALARQSDPVIVTCYNGATASGLYIATSFIIEKMKLEHECDVCLAVRTIRHNRRQFVASEEQFEFLYRTSLTYINGFQSYANFS